MAAVEQRQRAGHLLFSMDVEVATGGGQPQRRRMLGVSRGDPAATRLLYVVTLPRADRGATLLIEDARAPRTVDGMWLWLPGLMSLRRIESASLRAVVPGTGLTYEDARGFIATDKYRFRTLESASDELTIEAVPKADSLAINLGVSKLVVRVDPQLDVVTGMVAHDQAGNVARTYEAEGFIEAGGRWYPERVVTHHASRRIDATITYRYRALDKPPPLELFEPDGPGETIIDRVLAWRRRTGLDAAFPDSLESTSAR
jgi:hypothetical protein